MLKSIQHFLSLKRQEGQTATEYALVLGALVVGLGGAAIPLRDQIVTFINKVGAALIALPF